MVSCSSNRRLSHSEQVLIPKIKLEKSPGYTFAVGKIRVLESRLLEPLVLYQLADCRTVEEIESILSGSSYSKSISIADFEVSLQREELATLKLIRELSEDKRFLLPFFYKRDFHNLKLVVKSKNSPVERKWIKEGSLHLEIVMQALEEKNPSILPDPFGSNGKEAEAIYKENQRWEVIDIFLDKKLYEEIFAAIENLPFIEDFFRMEVDLLNIRSYLRCKRRDISKPQFISFMIPGGFLKEGFLEDIYEGPASRLVEKLKFTPYSLISEDGIPYLEKTGRFFRIEQNSQLILLNYLSSAKYTAFGYEPLVRYLLLKMNELGNLRMIFLGKKNRIEPDEIKERLVIP